MRHSLDSIQDHARQALSRAGIPDENGAIAANAAWLEAVSYPGLKILAEALSDQDRDLKLERDAIGFDLKNVSCVFLFPFLHHDVLANGRVFLRNVRHGLFLVKGSVEANYAIGCPVDPSFALGGERLKNPYEEKLSIAQRDGVDIPDDVWSALL